MRSGIAMVCRLGSQRYSRFGNLRYQTNTPASEFGLNPCRKFLTQRRSAPEPQSAGRRAVPRSQRAVRQRDAGQSEDVSPYPPAADGDRPRSGKIFARHNDVGESTAKERRRNGSLRGTQSKDCFAAFAMSSASSRFSRSSSSASFRSHGLGDIPRYAACFSGSLTRNATKLPLVFSPVD